MVPDVPAEALVVVVVVATVMPVVAVLVSCELPATLPIRGSGPGVVLAENVCECPGSVTTEVDVEVAA